MKPTTAKTRKAKTPEQATETPNVDAPPVADPAPREALIAVAAYFRAERRGFAPGGELDDWVAAEREIDAAPANEAPSGKA